MTVHHLRDPRGLYMRLTDRTLLREWMTYREHTARSLADTVGVSHQFIGHLMTGHRRTCKPDTARRIAKALACPPGTLFEPRVSNGHTADRQDVA